MKAILVIDMPTNCMDCPMCQLSEWDGEYHCFGANSDEANFKGDKPDWCPLRPLPKRKHPMPIGNHYEWNMICQAWNTCLDEILGETK